MQTRKLPRKVEAVSKTKLERAQVGEDSAVEMLQRELVRRQDAEAAVLQLAKRYERLDRDFSDACTAAHLRGAAEAKAEARELQRRLDRIASDCQSCEAAYGNDMNDFGCAAFARIRNIAEGGSK